MNHDHLTKPHVESSESNPPAMVLSPLGKALGFGGAALVMLGGVFTLSGENGTLLALLGFGISLAGRLVPKVPRA